jgi:ParB-like chromosome segregation protein Spo0J
MQIRDRIRELRRVRASDLLANPKNWRVHTKAQTAALRGLFAEVGYADALLARELADGRLQLIDGHLRAETTPSAMVPVLILDVSEEEADKILLTLDPLTSMAESDSERLQALLNNVRTDSKAVEQLFARIAEQDGLLLRPPVEILDPEPQIERAAELQKKVVHSAQPTLANRATPTRMWRQHQQGGCRETLARRRSSDPGNLDRPAIRDRLRPEQEHCSPTTAQGHFCKEEHCQRFALAE